jgi:hypothetical protein
MNKLKDIGNHCVECGCDTSFGSGNFVNRIPADDGEKEGYMCAFCMASECDRCDKTIAMDEDITPYDVYSDNDTGEFSDGAYRVHEECLTPEEHKLWEVELDI